MEDGWMLFLNAVYASIMQETHENPFVLLFTSLITLLTF